MADTLIKIDLDKSPYENDMIHNRWHPDIPMVATVKPGDDFIIECYDWTGGKSTTTTAPMTCGMWI